MIAFAIPLKEFKLVAVALAMITAAQIQNQSEYDDSEKKSRLDDNNRPEPNVVYAVIIDAGSTGSRALAFKFIKTPNELELRESKKYSIYPSLSHFADDPDQAAQSISDLLSEVEKFVPQEFQNKTKLQLRATAGLRQLEGDKAKNILDKLKVLLEKSNFNTDDESVGILNGDEEGVFSWFTVNFLQKHLSGNWDRTTTVIDLGGGSVQISYIPKTGEHNEDFIHTYEIMDKTIRLYSKSYEHLGLMSGRERTYTKNGDFHTSPCLHKRAVGVHVFGPNTFHVRGDDNDFEIDYESCKKRIEKDVNFSLVDKPEGIGNQEIVASSFFYDRAKTEHLFEGSQGYTTVQSFYEAAKKECSEDFKEPKYAFLCLDLLYMALLLDKGFGLPLNTRINVLKQIDTHEISWALGAAYHLLQTEANKMPDENYRSIKI